MAGTSEDVEALANKLAALFGEPSEVEQKLPSPTEPAKDLSREDLEREFHFALVDLYRRSASEAGYNATRFAQMIANRGGLDTAHYLIQAKTASDGYMTLWEKGRLDLSVEFLAVSPRYRSLFSPSEVRSATRRLQDWGMDPKDYY